MKSPRVAMIVLNWNGRDDTVACLRSLRSLDYPNYEVVMVDNGSIDGSVEAVKASFPNVAILETGENLGFAEGNNVGLRHALAHGADYALLLNNDTEVVHDFISLLVGAIEGIPQAGVAGPTIYYFDRPTTIWSAGGAIDWSRGRTRMVGLDEVDRGQFGESPRPVDFVTGCALLIKMPLVEQVGLLDPRFFTYYEETEWCLRVARAGFKILHVPQAKVWHKISPVAREASPRVHYYMTRNRLLFLELSGAGGGAWLNALLVDYGRTLVSWTLQPRWRNKAPQRRAMLQAILDYGRRRFGKMGVA
jgi:GT2 family glycosyltransferase